MSNGYGLPRIYAVWFSPSQIEREEVALTREADEGFRYTVRLGGQVDPNWRCAFADAQLNDTGFFRYRLLPADPLVRFVARSDDEGELRRLLERLQALLDLANGAANAAAMPKTHESNSESPRRLEP